MFDITREKGFHLSFDNGWKVSVQFGTSNYCQHRAYGYTETEYRGESKDAEIAVWTPDGKFYRITAYDDVEGHLSADTVGLLIGKVAALSEADAPVYSRNNPDPLGLLAP